MNDTAATGQNNFATELARLAAAQKGGIARYTLSDGLVVWVRKAGRRNAAWRYALLGMVTKPLRLGVLKPVPNLGGEKAVATEAHRLRELKAAGVNYQKGDFPFAANGRAKALGAAEGFVKILVDADSDEILGAHIIGPSASELIHELVIAMEYYAASEDIARSMHAHPTLAEAIHEAALAVDGRAIHKANPKRR